MWRNRDRGKVWQLGFVLIQLVPLRIKGLHTRTSPGSGDVGRELGGGPRIGGEVARQQAEKRRIRLQLPVEVDEEDTVATGRKVADSRKVRFDEVVETRKVGALRPEPMPLLVDRAFPPYDRLIKDERVASNPSVLARSGVRATTIVRLAERLESMLRGPRAILGGLEPVDAARLYFSGRNAVGRWPLDAHEPVASFGGGAPWLRHKCARLLASTLVVVKSSWLPSW